MDLKRSLAIVACLLIAACGGGGGGGNNGNTGGNTGGGTTTPPPPTPTYTDSNTYSSSGTAGLASPNEITAVTKHSLVIGSTTLNYTATVGHLTAMTLTNPAPEASFFYIAYTLDGANPGTRPVTFFYNGGPGSATVWLHLGSFGPKRLATNAPSTTTPTPFAFVDNTESLLDVSDLVFVDAVGTGFSEAISPNLNRTFWGTDIDAQVFRDFVMRYVAVNGRTSSPKFLFGESYGTPRSAILVNLLESAGTQMTGVVLQSSILNYNSNCGVFNVVTISCYAYLPSYAAVGAWLNLVTPPQPVAQLPAYMALMRPYASNVYDPAVRGQMAGAGVSGTIATQLAADTGMSAGNWSAHFNMDPTYFHDNLVPGSVIGFYDGRMVAQRGTPLAADDDPSSTFYNDPFSTTIVSYLSNDLHYTTPSTYTVTSSAINVWNFSHAGLQFPDTIPDLAAAIAQNPKLRVFSANGYHDIVTPFYNTEVDLVRLNAPNANISTHFYEGGHMTYLDDVGRQQEKAELAAFYASAVSAKVAEAAAPAAPAPSRAFVETPRPIGTMPAAAIEMKLRDPMLPESLRNLKPTPPTTGNALRAQVEERLRGLFDSARPKRAGLLTLEEARAAGLGYIANNFQAIDTRGTGAVSFDDVKRFMRERGATTLPN